ncbi:U-box domain-containing protein 14-like [Cucurbita maxima]|uniref:U-box domain-containing protein 12 n=1 Tax=Cucurbita maxima TaxID=3661 RepID=A0A6J1JHG6_CUCMA|nr:U-box domain-containing protein 14-like [Cucurbita maxima]
MGGSEKELKDFVREISELPECNGVCKKMYGELIRRVKLLSPMFEELRDGEEELGLDVLKSLELLTTALDSAMELLRSVNRGSKLYQALQLEKMVLEFQHKTQDIAAALSKLPIDELGISDEVWEQTELVQSQFKRAKERLHLADAQLDKDLAILHEEEDPNLEILKRLSEKLHLRTINNLKKESLAIHELVISSDGDPGGVFGKMSSILKKLKDFVQTENPEVETSQDKTSIIIEHKSPVIPDDFRCPISLEMMRDPVVVSTGQTYERSCIQKWLDSGHITCPRSQQVLVRTALTPNYVLKSLIALWCDNNGVELPSKQGSCVNKKPGNSISDCDRAAIDALLVKLVNGSPEQKRSAAGALRLLAKRNSDNRICIAEAGAIPFLVELLSSNDTRTKEHAVTAMLNLSINDGNKRRIVDLRALPAIVEVLKNGSMEARENAAATLFSLSVIDENKVAIGAARAIPSLISLLCEGTTRGKKDAAAAIFNLSIYQGNKARAVRAGIVNPLMGFLKDSGGGMVDEALAILAILATHHEGKMAIRQTEPTAILLEFIRTGSPRNQENAAAVLWSLCSTDFEQLKVAGEHGAEVALMEVSENGTERAKRKAGSILELFQRFDGPSANR